MSEQTVDMVRVAMEAWNRGDWDAAQANFDPAIEWHLVGGAPGFRGVYHGREEVRGFWDEWVNAWESIQVDPEEFIDLGERVLVPLRFRGRGRDGIEVEHSVGFVFTVRDDRLVAFHGYWNAAEAYEATEVDPPMS